jgi:hypothetical protein
MVFNRHTVAPASGSPAAGRSRARTIVMNIATGFAALREHFFTDRFMQ